MQEVLAKADSSGEELSGQLLDIVAERTDEVPLFVEKLLKFLQEMGAIAQSGLGVGLNDAIDSSAIPHSLQSILTAQLDKFRGAKRVAQIAACIGREFSDELLLAVAQLSATELQTQPTEISASDMIVPTGQTTAAEFIFCHALVRDAAYGSLLFLKRQDIHGSSRSSTRSK